MITIPYPSQDEIDERKTLAIALHKEHLLSKTGEMYPFDPDNLLEAIANMSEKQKVAFAGRAENADRENYFSDELTAILGEYITLTSKNYWTPRAEKKAEEVVDLNF